ncbi:hypothetical protein SprV_0100206100 [Sparganum proliferum]
MGRSGGAGGDGGGRGRGRGRGGGGGGGGDGGAVGGGGGGGGDDGDGDYRRRRGNRGIDIADAGGGRDCAAPGIVSPFEVVDVRVVRVAVAGDDGGVFGCGRKSCPAVIAFVGKFFSSAILKLAERVALDIIKPFSSSFSDPLQFAYKAKRSTLDAVALVVHSALKALDKCCREYACAFLDYSSAFNTVPRPLLLTKTSACGSPGWVVSWLSDYFTSRTQFVQSSKWKSSTLPNDCGVLQGSVLSPHLFSLHTDDLRSPNDCLLVKYADDVVVGHPLKSQTHLRSLKDGLNHVLAWSEENGLLINNQKSVQCIFRLRPSPNPDSSDILPNEVSSFSRNGGAGGDGGGRGGGGGRGRGGDGGAVGGGGDDCDGDYRRRRGNRGIDIADAGGGRDCAAPGIVSPFEVVDEPVLRVALAGDDGGVFGCGRKSCPAVIAFVGKFLYLRTKRTYVHNGI